MGAGAPVLSLSRICQSPHPLGGPVVSPCVCLRLRVHVLLREGAVTEKR